MQQIEIKENEAGQRLDKFLHKFMPLAPASFLKAIRNLLLGINFLFTFQRKQSKIL